MATYQPKPSTFQKKTEVQQNDGDMIVLWENKGRLGLFNSLYKSLRSQEKSVFATRKT
jgi:hypothetical protein